MSEQDVPLVIYNPKVFNGRPGVDIKDIWMRKAVNIEAGEIVVFQDEFLVDYLQRKYGFLKIAQEPSDLLKFKNMQKKQEKAPKSKKEVRKQRFSNLTKKQKEFLEELRVADPEGPEVFVPSVGKQRLTPEMAENIPASGTKDKDGVEWYGPGLQQDNIGSSQMISRVPGKTRGTFGAS